MRKDSAGSRPLAGCLLRQLSVTYVPQSSVSPLQAYIEVTVVGIGAPTDEVGYTGSALIPLTRVVAPVAYTHPGVPR